MMDPLVPYECNVSRSVMSDSLRPHGLWPTSLLCGILYARILE